MGNRSIPRRSMTFMYLVWTVSTIAIAGYGLATSAWQLMAACFVFNALEGAGTIVWATTKQRLVPARLLGRVSSFDWFISIGLVPVSFALTGPIANVLGPRTTLVGAGLLGGVVTLAFLFVPGMRAVEKELAEPRPVERVERGQPELQRPLPPLLEAMMEPDPVPGAFALDPEPAPEISLREAFAAVAVADPEDEHPAAPPPDPRPRTRLGDTWAFPARG
jgi:hypothetical protein